MHAHPEGEVRPSHAPPSRSWGPDLVPSAGLVPGTGSEHGSRSLEPVPSPTDQECVARMSHSGPWRQSGLRDRAPLAPWTGMWSLHGARRVPAPRVSAVIQFLQQVSGFGLWDWAAAGSALLPEPVLWAEPAARKPECPALPAVGSRLLRLPAGRSSCAPVPRAPP